MIKTKLNWQLYVKTSRNKAIEEIKNIISKNEGYIIYSNLFSDLALTLTVEIEEKNIKSLYLELDREFSIQDSGIQKIDLNSNQEWWVLMNISFGKGKGNISTKVPNVPG